MPISMCCPSPGGSWWRHPTTLLLIACALLCAALSSGCMPRQALTVPDLARPHLLSRPARLEIVMQGPEGPVSAWIQAEAGWVVAHPLALVAREGER